MLLTSEHLAFTFIAPSFLPLTNRCLLLLKRMLLLNRLPLALIKDPCNRVLVQEPTLKRAVARLSTCVVSLSRTMLVSLSGNKGGILPRSGLVSLVLSYKTTV